MRWRERSAEKSVARTSSNSTHTLTCSQRRLGEPCWRAQCACAVVRSAAHAQRASGATHRSVLQRAGMCSSAACGALVQAHPKQRTHTNPDLVALSMRHWAKGVHWRPAAACC